MNWIYNKVVHRGEHTVISLLGGRIHANMSTNHNPGTWFIYFGKWMRITRSKTNFGFAFVPHFSHVYIHFIRHHYTVLWTRRCNSGSH